MEITDIETDILDLCVLNIGGTEIVEVAHKGGYIGYYKDQGKYKLAHKIEIEGEIPVASFDMGHSRILRVLQSKKGASLYISESKRDGWEFNVVDSGRELKRGISQVHYERESATILTSTVIDEDFDPKSQLKLFELRGRVLHLLCKVNYYGVSTCVALLKNRVLLGTRSGNVILYEIKGSMFKPKTFELVAKTKLKGGIETALLLKKDFAIVGTSTGSIFLLRFKKKGKVEPFELSIQDAWEGRRRVKGKITQLLDIREVKHTPIEVLAMTAEIHEYEGKKEATGSVIEMTSGDEEPFELNFVKIPIERAVMFDRDLVYTEVASTKLSAIVPYLDR